MVQYDQKKPLYSLHIPKSGGNSFIALLSKWFNSHTLPRFENRPKIFKLLYRTDLDLRLQQLMGCGLYFHYKNHFLNLKPKVVPFPNRYGLTFRRKPECIHGHFDPWADEGNLFTFYPKADQFITFFRDPLDIQLSLFFYMRKMVKSQNLFWHGKMTQTDEFVDDIDHWLENRPLFILHFLPWPISAGNFKEVLNNNFVHIGVVEHFQRSVDIMADKLGFPRMAIPHENATERFEKPSNSSVQIFKAKHRLEYDMYDFALRLNEK